jgi:hypothetical protein
MGGPSRALPCRLTGEVAEWLKAHAWKVCKRETVSGVRIPLSPPVSLHTPSLSECAPPKSPYLYDFSDLLKSRFRTTEREFAPEQANFQAQSLPVTQVDEFGRNRPSRT